MVYADVKPKSSRNSTSSSNANHKVTAPADDVTYSEVIVLRPKPQWDTLYMVFLLVEDNRKKRLSEVFMWLTFTVIVIILWKSIFTPDSNHHHFCSCSAHPVHTLLLELNDKVSLSVCTRCVIVSCSDANKPFSIKNIKSLQILCQNQRNTLSWWCC